MAYWKPDRRRSPSPRRDFDRSDPSKNDRPEEFRAILTGSEEVPPVRTFSSGLFQAVLEGCQLHYTLTLRDMIGLTEAHLHLGKPGSNGPVVAFLYGRSGPADKLDLAVRRGTLHDKDLMGPLAGRTIDDLIKEMNKCNIYANVHTVAHPNGEIRGQVLSTRAPCDICRPKKHPKCKCNPCRCDPCRCGEKGKSKSKNKCHCEKCTKKSHKSCDSSDSD